MPTVDYKQLYNELLDDVRSLASTFRSLQLAAPDREAPAYEDAHDLTQELVDSAERSENAVFWINELKLYDERNEANG